MREDPFWCAPLSYKYNWHWNYLWYSLAPKISHYHIAYSATGLTDISRISTKLSEYLVCWDQFNAKTFDSNCMTKERNNLPQKNKVSAAGRTSTSPPSTSSWWEPSGGLRTWPSGTSRAPSRSPDLFGNLLFCLESRALICSLCCCYSYVECEKTPVGSP